MINMVIINSTPRPPPGVVGYQAVAFRSSGNRTLVYNSSFHSYQDTLYADEGFQYYQNCEFNTTPAAQLPACFSTFLSLHMSATHLANSATSRA